METLKQILFIVALVALLWCIFNDVLPVALRMNQLVLLAVAALCCLLIWRL